jgi:hypothetical protein
MRLDNALVVVNRLIQFLPAYRESVWSEGGEALGEEGSS